MTTTERNKRRRLLDLTAKRQQAINNYIINHILSIAEQCAGILYSIPAVHSTGILYRYNTILYRVYLLSISSSSPPHPYILLGKPLMASKSSALNELTPPKKQSYNILHNVVNTQTTD